MNREIKFRAWLKDEKKMIDVKAIDFDDNGDVFSVNYPEDHIDIFLKLKSYMFYTATDNQGQFYGLLNMQEHQLLTELFKCYKWIE